MTCSIKIWLFVCKSVKKHQESRTGVVLARVNVISKGAPPFAPRNGCDMLDRARCPAWHHCSTVLATTELENCRCCSGIRSLMPCLHGSSCYSKGKASKGRAVLMGGDNSLGFGMLRSRPRSTRVHCGVAGVVEEQAWHSTAPLLNRRRVHKSPPLHYFLHKPSTEPTSPQSALRWVESCKYGICWVAVIIEICIKSFEDFFYFVVIL